MYKYTKVVFMIALLFLSACKQSTGPRNSVWVQVHPTVTSDLTLIEKKFKNYKSISSSPVMVSLSIKVFNGSNKKIDNVAIKVNKPPEPAVFSEGIGHISPSIQGDSTEEYTYDLLLDTDLSNARTTLERIQFVLSWLEEGKEQSMNISTFEK